MPVRPSLIPQASWPVGKSGNMMKCDSNMMRDIPWIYLGKYMDCHAIS